MQLLKHLKDRISKLPARKSKAEEDLGVHVGESGNNLPLPVKGSQKNAVPTLDIAASQRSFDVHPNYTTENGNLTVYSYGNQSPINVELRSPDQYRDSDFADCELPSACKTQKISDGTLIIGVGAVGRSTTAVVSNSFASCTPIVARFSDGSVGMYHAAFSPLNDLQRSQLLKAKPTDIFVITKDGQGAHVGRQTAQAIDTVQQAPPGTNVHIVTVPRATLAVEARPDRITIFSTTIRQRDLAHSQEPMSDDPKRVVSEAREDQNPKRTESGEISEVCKDMHKPAELHLASPSQDRPEEEARKAQSHDRASLRDYTRTREGACR